MTDTKTDETKRLQRGDLIKQSVYTREILSAYFDMHIDAVYRCRGDDHDIPYVKGYGFSKYETTIRQLFRTFENGMLDAAIVLEDEIIVSNKGENK